MTGWERFFYASGVIEWVFVMLAVLWMCWVLCSLKRKERIMETRVLSAIQESQGLKELPKKELKLKDDLGMDSLDIVELVMFLEVEFAIEIADEEAEKWTTIGDIVSYMVNR